jgi:hypothetical protein
MKYFLLARVFMATTSHAAHQVISFKFEQTESTPRRATFVTILAQKGVHVAYGFDIAQGEKAFDFTSGWSELASDPSGPYSITVTCHYLGQKREVRGIVLTYKTTESVSISASCPVYDKQLGIPQYTPKIE